ncbi:hypothetical protein QE152_g5453 [Popillia japonica]|uniref:CCHC-type domain-containing protein n=1 Tax=Popillia japonica TaxID=7064 RepID=A0AAW1MMY3_POPJA
MLEVQTFMAKLNSKTEELKQLVKESTKTKTEIKAATRELVNIVGTLGRKMDILSVHYTALVNNVSQVEQTTKTIDSEKERNQPCVQEKKEYCSIGVQADGNEIALEMEKYGNEIALEMEKCKVDLAKEIKNIFEDNEGWKGLSKIIDQKWPRDFFKNTTSIELQAIRRRNGKLGFPEIATLLEEKSEVTSIEYVRTNTETILSNGRRGKDSRTLYLIPYNMDQGGFNDICKLYETLDELAGKVVSHGIDDMQLVALGNINADYLRKCTEFAFRRTHKNIGIVMEKQTKPRTQVAKQLEKVIIKADGKQYADILRGGKTTGKSSVNIDKAGIMVNAIKKTTRGDVMVEIRGGKEKAETLRQEIIKNNRDTKVEIKNKNDTVFLIGIDGDVGKDEIVQAIKDSIGGEMQLQDIEIVSIRPTQYGGQNATVVLNKQWAIELCKRGTIRIGWTPCHVRQRINITRCYRCLEFGHHKWECKGKDNTSTCLKCGNSDHRAKECTGESYCLTCKKNGHRADQTRCPYYRKLIHEKTKELANEKGGRKDNTKTNPEKRQARLRSNSGVEAVRKNAHENTPN